MSGTYDLMMEALGFLHRAQYAVVIEAAGSSIPRRGRPMMFWFDFWCGVWTGWIVAGRSAAQRPLEPLTREEIAALGCDPPKAVTPHLRVVK